MFDDADLARWANGDPEEEGVAHIAGSLGRFRQALIDAGFKEREAFVMARDWFLGMVDAGVFLAPEPEE